MDNKLLKLPTLTLIGGIILQIVDFITLFVLIKGTSEWTLEMGTTSFYIRLVMSIILFVLIGIILRRIYDRKTFVKSATLLVAYSIVIFALQQIAQYYGAYEINMIVTNMVAHWLYLPITIFSSVTAVLLKFSAAESINWIYGIPQLFAPYLFVLFGKKSKSGS